MLVVEDLCKKYGDISVIENLNLELKAGCLHCFIGPSGSGKTTLLNLLTGMQPPTSGRIKGAEGVRMAYLFQEDRLLPWCTVEENLMFVLRSHMDESAAKAKVEHYLQVVELSEFKGRKPSELSGGMKQRVALARAFAYGGQWLMMDEPFKGLDRDLKIGLMDYTLGLCRREKTSLIYVTHDAQEAYYMADFVHEFVGPPLKWMKTTAIVDGYEERRSNYHRGTQIETFTIRLFNEGK